MNSPPSRYKVLVVNCDKHTLSSFSPSPPPSLSLLLYSSQFNDDSSLEVCFEKFPELLFSSSQPWHNPYAPIDMTKVAKAMNLLDDDNEKTEKQGHGEEYQEQQPQKDNYGTEKVREIKIIIIIIIIIIIVIVVVVIFRIRLIARFL